jgi:hypothetical protein
MRISAKRWKDKERRQLFERIRDHFIGLRKMKLSLCTIHPMLESKRAEKARRKKEAL